MAKRAESQGRLSAQFLLYLASQCNYWNEQCEIGGFSRMAHVGRRKYAIMAIMRVLIACEFSGIVREAFRRRGHDAWSCDLLPTEIPGHHIEGDILKILCGNWDMMIAHPPCTYLTLAGNKWMLPKFKDRFPNRKQQRQQAIDFFLEISNAPIDRIAIENPIGIMSTHYKRPSQIIQPHHFGVPIRKPTCLWLKNIPPLISTLIDRPELDVFPSGNTQSKWHTETGHIKDPIERSKTRSRTFPEIAEAMAEQWGSL